MNVMRKEFSEALDHFKKQEEIDFIEDWNHLIFHLPYSFQGRRMMVDIWINGWIKIIYC